MTRYPEDHEFCVKTWEKDGVTLSLLKSNRSLMNHYCGYVRLPKNPFKGNKRTYDTGFTVEYDGIVRYVPVHGGVTYAKSEDDGSIVFGFDCNHLNDDENGRLSDIDWLTNHCEQFGRWLLIAASFEDRYIDATDNTSRADVLDEMQESFGVPFGENNDIMTMFRVMAGSL